MTEIKIIDLLATICACFSMVTFTKLFSDIYRCEFRLSTKIFVVFTFLLLGGSLGYAFYDLFKGGVCFV